VGALFFINAFPSFLDGFLSPHLPVSPSIRQAQYQHSIVPHYGSPHNSDPNSSEEGCIANHGQDPYRYIMPRDGTYPTNLGQDSSSSQATWSNKTEDENGYATYPPAH